MSWSYQDWKQDDDIFYGYITPLKSAEYDQFDINEVFCGYKIDSQFYGYPHTVYGVAPKFDVSKVYHYFECNDAFYGYPTALGITFNPLGAFMGCTSLTSITIPESVYEFGTHTLFQSGIDSITISSITSNYIRLRRRLQNLTSKLCRGLTLSTPIVHSSQMHE